MTRSHWIIAAFLAAAGGAGGLAVLLERDVPEPLEDDTAAVAAEVPVAGDGDQPAPAEEAAAVAVEDVPEPVEEVLAAAAPVIPSFDAVRIEPDGTGLVAGRAAPGAEVALMVGDVAMAEAEADASGAFVAFLTLPPSEVPRVLSLMVGEGDAAVRSDSTIIIAPTAEPEVEVAEAEAETVVEPDVSEVDAADTELAELAEADLAEADGSAPEEDATELAELSIGEPVATETVGAEDPSMAEAVTDTAALADVVQPDGEDALDHAVAELSDDSKDPEAADVATEEVAESRDIGAEAGAVVAGAIAGALADVAETEGAADAAGASDADTSVAEGDVAAEVVDPEAAAAEAPLVETAEAAMPQAEDAGIGADVLEDGAVEAPLDDVVADVAAEITKTEDPVTEAALAETEAMETDPVAESAEADAPNQSAAETSEDVPPEIAVAEIVPEVADSPEPDTLVAVEATPEVPQVAPQVETAALGAGFGAQEDAAGETAVVAPQAAPEQAGVVTTALAQPEAEAAPSDAPQPVVAAEVPSLAVPELTVAPARMPVLMADAQGVRVLQPALAAGADAEVLRTVALDAISYDPSGDVVLTGRATGGGSVQVYLNNAPVVTADIGPDGVWSSGLAG